jgi:DNA repair protein RecO
MEGIILDSINFEDYHRIVTFYTPENGILKVFVKNASRFAAKFSYLKPLCKVHLIIEAGKKDLYYLQEGNLIKNFLESINHYEQIHIGTCLIKSLLITQFSNEASKEVYLLFEALLSGLSLAKNPENLLRCFQVKILIFEGLLNLESLNQFLSFSDDEKKKILDLHKTRSLIELDELQLNKTLGLKIQALFDDLT